MISRVLIVVIFILNLNSVFFAQDSNNYYQNIYDNSFFDVSLAFSKNDKEDAFSWEGSYKLESLVIMYELTGDVKYLKASVESVGSIIDRRDDIRVEKKDDDLTNKLIEYCNQNKLAEANPVWSSYRYSNSTYTNTPFGYIVHSGNITYPMAKLANLILRNTEGIKDEYYITSSDISSRYLGMTYSEIADAVIKRVIETISYHEDKWVVYNENIGYYIARKGAYKKLKEGRKLPLNMMASIGKTFVHLYKYTNNDVYLNKIVELANFFKLNTHYKVDTDSYKWRYYGNLSGVYDKSVLRDDVAHAGLTISFPFECYKEEIKKSDELIYTYSDMQKYANTFSKDIYQGYLKFNNGVDYTEQVWDFQTKEPFYKSSKPASNGTYNLFRWIPYSQFNREIFQQIIECQTNSTYKDLVYKFKKPLNLALLAKYSN